MSARILGLKIKGFQQFQDISFDFSYPIGHIDEGEPLKKICLIGRNGTGKTTILEILKELILSAIQFDSMPAVLSMARYCIKYRIKDKNVYVLKAHKYGRYIIECDISTSADEDIFIESIMDGSFFKNVTSFINIRNKIKYPLHGRNGYRKEFIFIPTGQYDPIINEEGDLLVFVSGEHKGDEKLLDVDMPSANLDAAQALFKGIKSVQIVHPDSYRDFWRNLIFHIKNRESKLLQEFNSNESSNLTVYQVRDKFIRNNPEILKEISELWNVMLNKAGLYFDYQSAIIPLQLSDNLEAYIKSINSKNTIHYSRLSSGIRDYIFTIGHVHSIYFERNFRNGFIFIDEPEKSLYPDFVYGMIDSYMGIIKHSQLFVASHSPIIAAQFEPSERFILDFNDQGFVDYRKGRVAIGDDPNDMLDIDFGVTSIYGKQGQIAFKRFYELRDLISQEQDRSVKKQLMKEYLELGNQYNFLAEDAIS